MLPAQIVLSLAVPEFSVAVSEPDGCSFTVMVDDAGVTAHGPSV